MVGNCVAPSCFRRQCAGPCRTAAACGRVRTRGTWFRRASGRRRVAVGGEHAAFERRAILARSLASPQFAQPGFGPAKRTHAALARSTEWRAWRRALGERVPRAGALGYASNLAAPLFALLGNLRDLSEDRIGRPKWRTRADSLMRAAISLIADLNSLQGRKKFPVRMRRELAYNALIYCPFCCHLRAAEPRIDEIPCKVPASREFGIFRG